MMEQARAGPLVSVCVTAYNHGPFLRRCIDSLATQHTDFPLEILVGEDCSTDDTRTVVLEFAQRHPRLVKPLLNERNLGMFGNYRAVHASAAGELVCHCDGDDYWEPGKLQAQVDFMREHPRCPVVFTNSHVISEDGQRIGRFNSGVPQTFDLDYLMRDGNFLHHSTMMYRREHRDRIIPAQGEFIDFQIYGRLASIGPLGYIDRCLANYRSQSTASAIQNNNERVRRLVWQAMQEMQRLGAQPATVRQAQAAFLANAALHALRARQPRRYLEWVKWVGAHGACVGASTHGRVLARVLRASAAKLGRQLRVHPAQGEGVAKVFYPK